MPIVQSLQILGALAKVIEQLNFSIANPADGRFESNSATIHAMESPKRNIPASAIAMSAGQKHNRPESARRRGDFMGMGSDDSSESESDSGKGKVGVDVEVDDENEEEAEEEEESDEGEDEHENQDVESDAVQTTEDEDGATIVKHDRVDMFKDYKTKEAVVDENAVPRERQDLTVDAFQGREKKIIIVHFVSTNEGDRPFGHVSKSNRLCVTTTRAQQYQFLFGNISFWCEKMALNEQIKKSNQEMSKLVEYVRGKRQVVSWTNVRPLRSAAPDSQRARAGGDSEDMTVANELW